MPGLYDGWSGIHEEDFDVIGDDGTEIAWYAGNVGFIEAHPNPQGGRCQGSVAIDPEKFPGSPHWTIEAGTAGVTEGLTLSPSILCRTCGHHGWIREGRWVSA